eukprot:Gregarina_sp_Pseudo_9__4183@NODE_4333_length_445_cov_2_827586_g4002_i0_p3_GENE_NODE_4333_length_445_cov_2_827586_g4002_i0NODE_4333_length_445_cov_2_827586_g4002_i0_p3_ORF_typecomplete_len111_score29_17_NODE_4333_length_445_cov_2_827586_g4002_i036368
MAGRSWLQSYNWQEGLGRRRVSKFQFVGSLVGDALFSVAGSQGLLVETLACVGCTLLVGTALTCLWLKATGDAARMRSDLLWKEAYKVAVANDRRARNMQPRLVGKRNYR